MVIGQSGGQTTVMIVRGVNVEPFSLQKATQQIDERVVVIDDEQLIHRTYFAFSRLRLR